MRTFTAAILATVGAARVLDELDVAFMNYIAEHGKSYADLEEFNLRFALFSKFDAEVKHHNATETTSTHGHNFLSDWTAAEKAALLGLANMPEEPSEPMTDAVETVGIPTSINWCTSGACNPIQNQGNCGSCWAFSAAAAMESAHKIQQGSLYKLSEQNFVSCSSAYGNNGCGGGWYYWAWNYAKVTPVDTEASYPYTSGSTGTTGACKYVSSAGVGKVTGYGQCGTDTTSIKTCIASQPNSVAIDASTSYFQSYTGGVLTNAASCGTTLDHAVVAVGYNTTSTGVGYYIVRNSWGTGWGSNGYVNIGQAASPGICGINKKVYYVAVAK